jgi:hypothetical protein
VLVWRNLDVYQNHVSQERVICGLSLIISVHYKRYVKDLRLFYAI